MAKHKYGCRLLISEHGIYTREREEELIKAKWVTGVYKNIWIDQFRKMSRLAYQESSLVTSLFEQARQLQIELGCPPEKTVVTPNGIRVENLQNLAGKQPEDEEKINIGAVLRVTPIKDVKTMIQAFGFAKEKDDRLKTLDYGTMGRRPGICRGVFPACLGYGNPGCCFYRKNQYPRLSWKNGCDHSDQHK